MTEWEETKNYELGDTAIIEPVTRKGKRIDPFTKISLPLRTDYFGRRDFDEYEGLIRESINLEISTLFSLCGFLSSLMRDGEYKEEVLSEFITTCSRLGKAFNEANETVETEFKRYRENAGKPAKSKPAEIPQDFIDSVETADVFRMGAIFAGVLRNKHLPVSLGNDIKILLNDLFNDLSLDEDDKELDDFEDFSASYIGLLIDKYNKSGGRVKPPGSKPDNEDLANDISKLLKHPELPSEVYNGIVDAISDMSNERNNGLKFDQPDYIKFVFDNFADSDESEEKEQSPKVLDLSSQPENLNILANQISDILKNPELPASVYECITEAFNVSPQSAFESPEWILHNLQTQKEGNQ